jgi:hypothetical protein
MTIEIHNPELESILQQQLKAGNFASVEDMLLQTFRGVQSPGDEQRKVRALARCRRAYPRASQGRNAQSPGRRVPPRIRSYRAPVLIDGCFRAGCFGLHAMVLRGRSDSRIGTVIAEGRAPACASRSVYLAMGDHERRCGRRSPKEDHA